MANRKGAYPLAEVFEEFSTVTVHTIDRTIATGRSNKIAVTLCLQNADQLRRLYGKEFAGAVINTCGNVLSGQVSGETAQLLADRFGKIRQDRESITASYADTSVTMGEQLDCAIPVSRIASLSAGEFVGMVADDPQQPAELKMFCCRFVNDPAALAAEAAVFEDLPAARVVGPEEISRNFLRIAVEVEGIVIREEARIAASPELAWVRG